MVTTCLRSWTCARLLTLAAALACLQAATPAAAGNWSSGGGEILEHASNPWFLRSPGRTEPFRYCVAAGDDFPVKAPELSAAVERALSFWDKQFSNAHHPDNIVVTTNGVANVKVQINTSLRVKEPCSDTTDLSFQFGVLLRDQEQEFNRLQIDLTRYVALTIRTDYSDMLRGRGFIYVSPDRGPRAFKGQNILKDAWTQPNDERRVSYRLDSVVAHELGHVFGLSHAATADSIMSARLAEVMVSPLNSSDLTLWASGIGGAVFFPPSGAAHEDCNRPMYTRAFRDFFEIPDAMGCLRVDFSLNRLKVEVRADFDSHQWLPIGAAEFTTPSDRRHQQLVTLWLPRTQHLFPQLRQDVVSLLGPAASEVQQSAHFIFAGSGKSKPIFVQASPRHLQIGGVGANGIIPDLLPVSSFRRVSGWAP